MATRLDRGRSRRTQVKLAVVGILLGVLMMGPARAENLVDTLVSAYNNSNILAQNRALLRANDEDVAIALSALRPQINAVAQTVQSDQASNPGRGSLVSSVDLTLNLLVYDAGRSRLGVEAAKETVLAARAQLLDFEQQVLLNAVVAYLNVLSDTRVVQLREGNLRLISQELRAAQDRFDVGEVTRTDVAQAEARLAQARGDLEAARGSLSVSREVFQATVGRAPGRLSAIRTLPSLPGSVAEARRLGERMHPLVKQAQSLIKVNELNAARAKAAMKPQLNLSARVGHSETFDNNSSVALQLNVPIYQGGQLKALERKALAQVHASRSNLNQVVLQTRQSVGQSWSQLAISQAQLQASERQIRAAEVAFEGVREEAKVGSRTTLDVLDAEQVLFDARTNMIVFETQVYAAAYQLLSSLGLMTASNLNLPVKQYDPSEYYNAVKSAPVPKTKQGEKLDRILGRYQK